MSPGPIFEPEDFGEMFTPEMQTTYNEMQKELQK